MVSLKLLNYHFLHHFVRCCMSNIYRKQSNTTYLFTYASSVFMDKQQATSLISRQKRGTEASTLEQACMERVCTYDEARRFFQDTYRTVSLILLHWESISF